MLKIALRLEKDVPDLSLTGYEDEDSSHRVVASGVRMEMDQQYEVTEGRTQKAG